MADAASDGVGSVAQLIDGKAISQQIHGEVAEGVAKLKEATGVTPGLAVLIMGDRKDSQTYVRMKVKACGEAGIASFERKLPGSASQEEVVAAVREFNSDASVHGILVQLPLPPHISEEAVLSEVALAKDVDGFHPINVGQLAMKGRRPMFAPCTPEGCMILLERSGISISGKTAVVLGRSNIVGLPAAMLLMQRDATVTVVHSRTKDIPKVVREADIVVAAIGKAHMVKADWLKPGCAVIDVGINPIDDSSKKAGYRLVGDVDTEAAKEVARWITPVPGGVGPMTIAVLLQHTLLAAERAAAKSS